MRIGETERGLVFKQNNYERLLMPGRYILFNRQVQRMSITSPFSPGRDIHLFLKDEKLKNELYITEVNDYEIALHFVDGLFKDVLKPGIHAYWKGLNIHSFTIIDTRNPEMDASFDKSLLYHEQMRPFFVAFSIEAHEKGLLTINRKFIRILEPGDYYFWKSSNPAVVYKADMRRQQIDMTGQDIMTKDTISIRINFVCHYTITDPEKTILEIKNYEEQLYILVQLMLREYVGTLTLNELLEKKEDVNTHVLDSIRKEAEQLGISVVYAGVKDIILPGDIKDILNQVLIAEKKAQANVIMRREETASTRSLLNTAKLMDENTTLARLKELEYIERISERINSISLSTNGRIMDQLADIFNASAKKAGDK